MAKTFKVVKNRETGEWVVKVYKDRKYSEAETYYTNDKKDAVDTMKAMKERESAKGTLGAHIKEEEVGLAAQRGFEWCKEYYKNRSSQHACRVGAGRGAQELYDIHFGAKPGLGRKKRRR